jgi:hypothetical protein
MKRKTIILTLDIVVLATSTILAVSYLFDERLWISGVCWLGVVILKTASVITNIYRKKKAKVVETK